MNFNANGATPVTLKGTKDGLLILLGDGEWDKVLDELELQLARPGASRFFRGAKVRVDTGARVLTTDEQGELSTLLDAYGIQVGAVVGALTVRPPREASIGDTLYRREGLLEALMLRRTLRSGQIVRHPGHVVVYGDVNPGAEVVAGGDVFVWGNLRGLVHAGAAGDDHATVGALALTPPQIRIGTYIARAPEDRPKKRQGPEMAAVRDGRIVIEPWQV